jgi:hypothetical protein
LTITKAFFQFLEQQFELGSMQLETVELLVAQESEVA